MERTALRDIRARAFGGKSMTEIETAYASGKLPGADAAVAHFMGGKSTAPASSSFPDSTTIAANSNMILTAENRGRRCS